MKKDFKQRNNSINLIDPKTYKLSSRTILENCGKDRIAIIKKRSSRIIMSDGIKIFEIAKQIRSCDKSKTILLKTNAPVCSKTLIFLKHNKIEIISETIQ